MTDSAKETTHASDDHMVRTKAGTCRLEPPGAICVAIPVEGQPFKIHGKTTQEFISTLAKAAFAWINFTVQDLEKDGTEIASNLGFSSNMVQNLLKGYYASIEDLDTEMGMMVPAVMVSGLDLHSYPLIILVRKDLIVTIHSEEVLRLINFSRYAEHYAKRFPTAMPVQDKLTMMLIRILDENNNVNFEQLREIEEHADDMSQMLLDASTSRQAIGKQVYEMKHTLITYLNTLWRTLDVLHTLRFGDSELISDEPKVLSQLGLLADDVNRQIALSEHMSSVLASGLEVLQALYNNQLQILNNRMALTMTWLTILGTAVLVPNTLATYFGAINGVDETKMIFYSVLLFISTINFTVLAWWWVKRKVRVPKQADDTTDMRSKEVKKKR
jgi:magnesium transporter